MTFVPKACFIIFIPCSVRILAIKLEVCEPTAIPLSGL